MTTPAQGELFDPKQFIEHQRSVNRTYDPTIEHTLNRAEAVMSTQLAEIGLVKWHTTYEHGERVHAFQYIEPRAVKVILQAVMTGKLPQPEGAGSLLYSERTALLRQSALDTYVERVKMQPSYDVTKDLDFYPEDGADNGQA